jgi:large subunit ribosomal protein L21
MLAIIKTGGKQYVVSPGDKIKIEKLEAAEEKEVVFKDVLLTVDDEEKTEIGGPLVKGAKVTAKVLKQGKNDKIKIWKYRPKKRYQVRKGYRQPYTMVEILKIEKRAKIKKAAVKKTK